MPSVSNVSCKITLLRAIQMYLVCGTACGTVLRKEHLLSIGIVGNAECDLEAL